MYRITKQINRNRFRKVNFLDKNKTFPYWTRFILCK